MGMFSGWTDQLVALRFRKDSSERLVFLPFGPRKPGYYVDAASDAQVIKSLVKMYAVASALINLMGYLASYTLAQLLVFNDHSAPLANRLKTGIAVYSISALVLMILPAWALWKTYKGLIRGCCATLSAVGPELIRQMEKPSNPLRKNALIAGAGVLLVGLAILAATSYRSHCPR